MRLYLIAIIFLLSGDLFAQTSICSSKADLGSDESFTIHNFDHERFEPDQLGQFSYAYYGANFISAYRVDNSSPGIPGDKEVVFTGVINRSYSTRVKEVCLAINKKKEIKALNITMTKGGAGIGWEATSYLQVLSVTRVDFENPNEIEINYLEDWGSARKIAYKVKLQELLVKP